MAAEARRVGILIFDDVEVLDFAGPFEVFSVTRLRDDTSNGSTRGPFDVSLIGLTAAPVRTVGGMQVTPRWSLADCPRLDVLVVPGGWGTRRLLGNNAIQSWLRSCEQKVELLTSVCTGALLLADAGLLDGRRATTHWQALETLEKLRPAVTVVRDQRVVEEGQTITAAGISAGIDMALGVVARLHGESVARATARQMEYSYPESNARRVTPPAAGRDDLGSAPVGPLRRAAIMVGNLDRSLALYRDVLGMVVWREGVGDGNPTFFDLLGVSARHARFAILQAQGSEIGMVGLFEVTDPSPASLGRAPAGGINLGEVALVFPVARIGVIADAIRALGLSFVCPPSHFDVPGGGLALEMTFRDPDGALVNLIERLPA